MAVCEHIGVCNAVCACGLVWPWPGGGLQSYNGRTPHTCAAQSEIQADLDQNKAFLPGYDRVGRPLCIVVVNRHKQLDFVTSRRCIAYSLDCAELMGSLGPAGGPS
jgi:hypothetical protein